MSYDLDWLEKNAARVEFDWPNNTVALTLKDGVTLVCPTLDECVMRARRAAAPPYRAPVVHAATCPLRLFSYEVGSGQDIPECTCGADKVSAELSVNSGS